MNWWNKSNYSIRNPSGDINARLELDEELSQEARRSTANGQQDLSNRREESRKELAQIKCASVHRPTAQCDPPPIRCAMRLRLHHAMRSQSRDTANSPNVLGGIANESCSIVKIHEPPRTWIQNLWRMESQSSEQFLNTPTVPLPRWRSRSRMGTLDLNTEISNRLQEASPNDLQIPGKNIKFQLTYWC
jgi:hypothetical protein